MLEITDAAEAALAYLMVNRDDLPYTTEDEMYVKALLDLRDAGMVKGETDWGHQMFIAMSILPAGVEHYQRARRYRRRFVSLTETADELVCMTYAAAAFRRRKGQSANIEVVDGRITDYQELAQTGLLGIKWADNVPWTIATTEKGLSYVRGDFMDEESEMSININNSPTFNNTNVGSVANATAKTEPISIEMAIEAIRASDADDDVKQSAEAAVVDMGEAAKEGNIEKFADALENTASIVKSTTALGTTLFPVIGELISKFFV